MVIFGEHDAIRCDDIQVGRMSSGKDLSVIDLIVQVGACVCVCCVKGELWDTRTNHAQFAVVDTTKDNLLIDRFKSIKEFDTPCN